MKILFHRFFRNLTILLTAFVLAIAVWIMNVNLTDPVEKRIFPQSVPLEIIGLDPSLVVRNTVVQSVKVTLSAPESVWKDITSNPQSVHAILKLNNFEEGVHDIEIGVQVSANPVKVENVSPGIVTINLEPVYSQSFPIKLIHPAPPAIGYEAGIADLSQTQAIVSGAASQVKKVTEVQGVLDISQAVTDIHRSISLQAVDENGQALPGVNISPKEVMVDIKIVQRGGYRNLVVKLVTNGQVAKGFRLTNISVWPINVVVYSQDPKIINDLTGTVDTQPVDINDANRDINTHVSLKLPQGLSVIGDPSVLVTISIMPIQSNVTLIDVPLEITGLSPALTAKTSPDKVDVILSGPLPLLDQLKRSDVHIVLDLTGYQVGSYLLNPQAKLNLPDIKVDSIQPISIQVALSISATPTPRSNP